MSANCQPFFFRVSFFSRISTVGSAHFLVVATCGFPVSGLMKVRRYSHSPDRKAGSSTPALLGAGAEVSAGAAAASGAGAVEAGAGVSGAPCAGSAPAAHSAASGASSRRTAARFSALRRGLRTGIEGSGSLVSEGQSIAERARRRSAASPRADNLGYGPPARYTRVKYTGGVDLGTTMYDMKAPKQTVSLTVNSDLYARAKKAGHQCLADRRGSPDTSARSQTRRADSGRDPRGPRRLQQLHRGARIPGRDGTRPLSRPRRCSLTSTATLCRRGGARIPARRPSPPSTICSLGFRAGHSSRRRSADALEPGAAGAGADPKACADPTRRAG